MPYLPLLGRNMFDLVWAFIVGKPLENDEQRLTHKADVISRFRALSGPDNDLSAKHIRLWNWYLGRWIEVVIRSVGGILYAYSICLTFEYTERIHVFIFSPLAKRGTCYKCLFWFNFTRVIPNLQADTIEHFEIHHSWQ